MKLQLFAEDRERLGVPEWIEYDQLHLSAKDAKAIEAAGGDWSAWGTLRIDGLMAAVWLAMENRTPTIDELDFDVRQIRVQSPGKAPSATSSSSTRSRSATTPPAKVGRSSRGKSNS